MRFADHALQGKRCDRDVSVSADCGVTSDK